METQTRVNIGFGAVIALIAGFVLIGNIEPTHYCESRELKMFCARTTAKYCYPVLETRLGSKKCEEGWKEIPFIEEVKEIIQTSVGSNRLHCNNKECKR